MSHSTDVTLTVGLDTYNFYSGSRMLANALGIACWESKEFVGNNVLQTLLKYAAFRTALGSHRYHFMIEAVEGEVTFIRDATYGMGEEALREELEHSIKLCISHAG